MTSALYPQDFSPRLHLVVVGPCGAGKTHLLRALLAEYGRSDDREVHLIAHDKNTPWLSADDISSFGTTREAFRETVSIVHRRMINRLYGPTPHFGEIILAVDDLRSVIGWEPLDSDTERKLSELITKGRDVGVLLWFTGIAGVRGRPIYRQQVFIPDSGIWPSEQIRRTASGWFRVLCVDPEHKAPATWARLARRPGLTSQAR
jgi:hypothetical protein